MDVLVTGGAGYIGSQTCVEILLRGHNLVVVDNLENGSILALDRIKHLANREFEFFDCDIRDESRLVKLCSQFVPDVVIHFAGLKSVSDSILMPEIYYDVNVGGTLSLLSAMEQVECRNIVFSSSATVYGVPVYLPCDEKHPLKPINPYGKTKLLAEQRLKDWTLSDPNRRAICLRYFNPVGADPSGTIGEDPLGEPNNLMPLVSQVAVGRKKSLKVFGCDYETVDGSGIRDYIHVLDLAKAHVSAINKISNLNSFETINVGTGQGTSVLQLIQMFEQQSGRKIDYTIAPRRSGDAPAVWADVTLASEKLGFKAERGLADMCLDTWRWQSNNPYGYLEVGT